MEHIVYKINIHTEGDAFHGGVSTAAREVARILRNLEAEITGNGYLPNTDLVDENGNTCGRAAKHIELLPLRYP